MQVTISPCECKNACILHQQASFHVAKSKEYLQMQMQDGKCAVVYMFAGLHGRLVQRPCCLFNCRFWSDQEWLLVVHELARPSEPQKQGAAQLRALHT